MRAHFDHLVLNVHDVERALRFYAETLGLPPENLEAWRRGDFPFASVRLDERAVLDLFGPELWKPAGGRAPGGQRFHHFSLVVDEADWAALEQRLRAAGVGVQAPRRLWGGGGFGTSWYVLDPEGNELELRVYREVDARELCFELHRDRERVTDDALARLELEAADFSRGGFERVAFMLANDELIGAARRGADGAVEVTVDPLFRELGFDERLRAEV